LTEWLTQTLNSAADVPQPEGFTAVISPSVKPVRMSNVCQIFARTVGVSGTLRVVDSIGGEDEYNRQLVMRGIELKRDLELVSTSNIPKAATDPRHMAGMPTFCSNGSVGAGGTMPDGGGFKSLPGSMDQIFVEVALSKVRQTDPFGFSPAS